MKNGKHFVRQNCPMLETRLRQAAFRGEPITTGLISEIVRKTYSPLNGAVKTDPQERETFITQLVGIYMESENVS